MIAYDIFLCSAPKDYNKLPLVLKQLTENLTGYEEIHLCTPKPLPKEMYDPIAKYPVHYHLDKEVLDIPINKCKYRPPWIYQQYLKLFQNVTKNDYYMVCDCDLLLINKFDVWDNGHPVWHYGWEQNHHQYYDFSEKMFGFGRVVPHTYIGDNGFYNKKMVSRMIQSRHYSVKEFIEESFNVITKDCYPCEQDLYAGYCYTVDPTMYVAKQLKLKAIGREHKDPNQQMWTHEDIKREILMARSQGYAAIAMHSWNNLTQYPW